MTKDPLLSDDLATLLRAFPNEALRDLVGVLKQHSSLVLLPVPRAYEAHELPLQGDFKLHVEAVAKEVLWWGRHDVRDIFLPPRGWRKVVAATATRLKAVTKDLEQPLPAWKLEDAIFAKTLAAWEKMTPFQREAVMKKAGMDANAARGAGLAGLGGLAAMSATQLITFFGTRAAGMAIPVIGPVLTVLGAIWAAVDLAGPSYRVLTPATLVIAFHRRRLRDARAAAAFRD